MSWLAGIAGKAEELLNKVDQAAATSLQNSSYEDGPISSQIRAQSERPTLSPQSISGAQLTGITGSISASSSVPSNLNQMGFSQDPLSQRSTSSAVTTSKPAIKPLTSKSMANLKDKDDVLFEFLNSTDNSSETKKNGNGRPRTLLPEHSRQSSNSSIGSRDRKTPDAVSVEDGASSSPGTPGE